MFETIPAAEFETFGLAGIEGFKAWHFVFRGMRCPWLHVSYSPRDEAEGTPFHLVLLDNAEQFIKLFGGHDYLIEELQLVTPGHLNKTGGWKMERVAQLWRGKSRADSETAYRFVLDDGREYVCSLFGTPKKIVGEQQLIFDVCNQTSAS